MVGRSGGHTGKQQRREVRKRRQLSSKPRSVGLEKARVREYAVERIGLNTASGSVDLFDNLQLNSTAGKSVRVYCKKAVIVTDI